MKERLQRNKEGGRREERERLKVMMADEEGSEAGSSERWRGFLPDSSVLLY